MPIISATMPHKYEVSKKADLKKEDKFDLPEPLNGMAATVFGCVGKKNLSLPVAELDERIPFAARLYISVIHYACVKHVLDSEGREMLFNDVLVNGTHVYWNSVLAVKNGEPLTMEFFQFRLAGKLHKYAIVWKRGKLEMVGSF